VPNKCHFFIWLVTHNRCWTLDRLARCNLPHPGQCPLFDQEGETINHLLATCVFTRQFWPYLLQHVDIPGISPQPYETTFEDWWGRVANLVLANVRGGLNLLIILGAWTFWWHRNDCVFNEASPRMSTAMAMAKDEA
jgi:hypothetical protein